MGNRVPPPVSTRWKKGQSGNPGGKPRLPEALREMQLIHADELKRVITKYMRMARGEAQVILSDPTTPMMDANILSGLEQGAKNGDLSKFSYLLDRLVGKVSQEMPVSVPVNAAENVPTADLLKKVTDGC
jgi:hypothetical protein